MTPVKKSKMKKAARLGTLMLLAAVITSSVNCRWHRWKSASPEKKATWIAEHISDELDLNEDQDKKLMAIKDELVAKWRSESESRLAMHRTLISEIKKEKIDQARLTADIKAHHDSRGAMIDFMVTKLAEFHAILTPEQRKKAAELLEKHHQRMQGDM